MQQPYRNREEAGRVLAQALRQYAGRQDVVVLALPAMPPVVLDTAPVELVSGGVLVWELPEMLPAVLSGEVLALPEALGAPVCPLELTVRWSFTLRLPAYCSAIFLAACLSFLEATVPFSSIVFSDTVTVMLSLPSAGSFLIAVSIWV